MLQYKYSCRLVVSIYAKRSIIVPSYGGAACALLLSCLKESIAHLVRNLRPALLSYVNCVCGYSIDQEIETVIRVCQCGEWQVEQIPQL